MLASKFSDKPVNSNKPEIMVSVIMPIHRIHQWLAEAIDSVSESIGVEVELVLVLDGLSQSSLKNMVLPKNAKVISFKKNRGVSSALAAGVVAAKSEYIARLDSDDFMSADRLLKQATYLMNHPDVTAVGCQMVEIDEQGRLIRKPNLSIGFDIRKDLIKSCTIPASGAMFRKSSYLEVGGIDTRLFLMEDYDLWLRLARLGPISNLPDELISYRIHTQQLSKKIKPWGYYIHKIVKGKIELAKHLKVDLWLYFKAVPLWLVDRWLVFLFPRKENS